MSWWENADGEIRVLIAPGILTFTPSLFLFLFFWLICLGILISWTIYLDCLLLWYSLNLQFTFYNVTKRKRVLKLIACVFKFLSFEENEEQFHACLPFAEAVVERDEWIKGVHPIIILLQFARENFQQSQISCIYYIEFWIILTVYMLFFIYLRITWT